MNISLIEPIGVEDEVVYQLADKLKKEGHCFHYYNKKSENLDELIGRSKGQDIIMIANHPYPEEAVRSAEHLKMLSVAFTGIDHIALDACRVRKIKICNCAGYSNQSVAELAVGMTLGLLRKFSQCEHAVKEGGDGSGLTGMEIAGKTVGIIGCGKIGFQAAKLFRAFGAKVCAFARRERMECKEEGIEYTDLDTLLVNSDIISLHLPLTEETRGLIDAEKIARMKPGALLINCARGAIVDNQALAEALKEGRLAGAGIDVFDMEPPLPEGYPLLQAPNVLLTPHVAFATKEAMARRAIILFDNVYAYLQGREQNVCQY